MTTFKNWIANHKKAAAMVLGLIIGMIPANVVDDDHKKWLLGIVMTFIGAQGVADHGKEAAKVNALANAPKV